MPFPRVLVPTEKQTTSSRIFYRDNRFVTIDQINRWTLTWMQGGDYVGILILKNIRYWHIDLSMRDFLSFIKFEFLTYWHKNTHTHFKIHQLTCFIQLCIPIFLLWYKLSKTFITVLKKTHLTQASNPWWWSMKGPKALWSILRNSSTDSNLKLRHLSENLKGS